MVLDEIPHAGFGEANLRGVANVGRGGAERDTAKGIEAGEQVAGAGNGADFQGAGGEAVLEVTAVLLENGVVLMVGGLPAKVGFEDFEDDLAVVADAVAVPVV